MKPFLSFLALTCLAIAPKAMAQGIPIEGAFAVSAVANLNTTSATYCEGTPLAVVVEAHGNGFTTLGALSLTLNKTIDIPGAMHGCLVLTAPNGDTINAVYNGTEGAPNANGFITATGTFTFTGGTGFFKNASGTATFTATFLGLSASFPIPVLAHYTFQGNIQL